MPAALFDDLKRPLNLLSAPSTICFAHVLWGFNRRGEFEHNVDNSNKTDDGTSDPSEPVIVDENGTDKDVDYEQGGSAVHWKANVTLGTYRYRAQGRRRGRMHILTIAVEFGTLFKD